MGYLLGVHTVMETVCGVSPEDNTLKCLAYLVALWVLVRNMIRIIDVIGIIIVISITFVILIINVISIT
jgi:hypothetical protein